MKLSPRSYRAPHSAECRSIGVVLFVRLWRLDQFHNLTTHYDKRDAPLAERHIGDRFNNCPCAGRLELGQCQRELAYFECA